MCRAFTHFVSVQVEVQEGEGHSMPPPRGLQAPNEYFKPKAKLKSQAECCISSRFRCLPQVKMLVQQWQAAGGKWKGHSGSCIQMGVQIK